MSRWTRDFITGVFGVRISDEEWAAHDEARRPKPRPVKLRIRYDNARTVPRHVADPAWSRKVGDTAELHRVIRDAKYDRDGLGRDDGNGTDRCDHGHSLANQISRRLR
jgi:hypothetical protein